MNTKLYWYIAQLPPALQRERLAELTQEERATYDYVLAAMQDIEKRQRKAERIAYLGARVRLEMQAYETVRQKQADVIAVLEEFQGKKIGEPFCEAIGNIWRYTELLVPVATTPKGDIMITVEAMGAPLCRLIEVTGQPIQDGQVVLDVLAARKNFTEHMEQIEKKLDDLIAYMPRIPVVLEEWEQHIDALRTIREEMPKTVWEAYHSMLATSL